MLRQLKTAFFSASNGAGLSRLLGASAWRRRRLLILCYHSVTPGDPSQWDPSLFMDAGTFARRLELLRQAKCSVLGLGEALRRLENGSLPPRSVAITFDDGFADFHSVAWPLLRKHGYPATLYLTTYYMTHSLPVFDPACGYVLWKGRARELEWPEVLPHPVLLDDAGRQIAARAVQSHAARKGLSGEAKDALLEELAERVGYDYSELRRSRLLSLINRDEAARLASEGADIQLHTHRHRTSLQRDRFLREIADNREVIATVSPRPAEHFCYPGGVSRPAYPEWLRECGVRSATTCDPGFATRQTSPYALPRMVDGLRVSEQEFVAWLHGPAGLVPRRKPAETEGQVMEEAEESLLPAHR
jgi:peptidoglycan/xylan/chitin deacetylase (PgdA/CDA1 family)